MKSNTDSVLTTITALRFPMHFPSALVLIRVIEVASFDPYGSEDEVVFAVGCVWRVLLPDSSESSTADGYLTISTSSLSSLLRWFRGAATGVRGSGECGSLSLTGVVTARVTGALLIRTRFVAALLLIVTFCV